MKYINGIEKLINKSLANPGRTYHLKNYKAVTTPAGMVLLEHYDTEILLANSNTKEIFKWDGWSVSDKNALNTAVEVLGIKNIAWIIKKGVLKSI